MLDDNAAVTSERAQDTAPANAKRAEKPEKSDKAGKTDSAEKSEASVSATAAPDARTAVTAASVDDAAPAPTIATEIAIVPPEVAAVEVAPETGKDSEDGDAESDETSVVASAPPVGADIAKPAPDAAPNTGDATDNPAKDAAAPAVPQLPAAPVTLPVAATKGAEDAAAEAPAAVAASASIAPRAAKIEIKSETGVAVKPDENTAPADAAPETTAKETGLTEAAQKADAQARGEVAARPQHAAHTTKPDAPAAPPAGDAVAKADAAQPMNAAPVTHQAAPAMHAPASQTAQTAPQSPQAPAVPVAGLAVEIAGRALAGKHHFEIRLDPPELGRIEVRLDVDRDGSVTSHVITDRRDTLDLLQRDSAALQRALQDAGLKTPDNALQFSLRDQSGQPQPENTRGGGAHIVVEDATLPAIDALQAAQSRLAARRGGIDIRI